MTSKSESQRHEAKKRNTRKVFERKEFSMDGKKSCRINNQTVIFIGENESCEVAKKKFNQVHLTYEQLYNPHGGGRKRSKYMEL